MIDSGTDVLAVLHQASSMAVEGPSSIIRHASEASVAVARRVSDAPSARQHPTMRAAGRTVLSAIRMARAIGEEQEHESEDDEEEPTFSLVMLRRVKVLTFRIMDSAVETLVSTVIAYPTLTMTLPTVLTAWRWRRTIAEEPWPGCFSYARELGIRGLYTGLLPAVCANITSNFCCNVPVLLFKTVTGRPPSKLTEVGLGYLGRWIGLAPQILIEKAWNRHVLIGGPMYSTMMQSVKSVYAEERILDVPWYELWVRIIQVAPSGLHWKNTMLPSDHPLAAERSLKEGLLTSWRTLSWRHSLKLSLRTWMNIPIGTLVGACVGIPACAIHNRARKLCLPLLLTKQEQTLDDKLLQAAEHTAEVRGIVSLTSLKRYQAKPKLNRTPTLALKQDAADGLEIKLRTLLHHLHDYESKTSGGLVLFGYSLKLPVYLVVKRDQLLKSLPMLAEKKLDKLRIHFAGELGADLGGVFRDYMASMASELKKSELFELGPDAGLLPARQTTEESEWKKALFAIGRLMALSITRNTPLDICLSRCVYKLILKEKIRADDVARIDPDFYKHRVAAVLKPGGVAAVEAVLCGELTFVGVPVGDSVVDELVPGGREKRVTEENKGQYISLLVEHYLIGRSRKELAMMVEGFLDVIPRRVLRRAELTAMELELLVAGLPSIDVSEWKASARIAPDSGEDANGMISWFWDVVEEMDAGERAKVLSFTCGSGRLGAGGFASMRPPFNICIMEAESADHLPSSHTCMNQLCLPVYDSKDKLKQMLTKAVHLEAGFGFA